MAILVPALVPYFTQTKSQLAMMGRGRAEGRPYARSKIMEPPAPFASLRIDSD
jgi:hypothetical protein